MLRGLLYALIAALSIGATAVAMAPAQWVASAIAQATGEHIVLAEARGSVWRSPHSSFVQAISLAAITA